jgi:hypothetical protein
MYELNYAKFLLYHITKLLLNPRIPSKLHCEGFQTLVTACEGFGILFSIATLVQSSFLPSRHCNEDSAQPKFGSAWTRSYQVRGCKFDITEIFSSLQWNALNCTLPRWKDKEKRTNMHWAQQLYESLGDFPMPWCTLFAPLSCWLLWIFDSKRPWATKMQALRATKLHQTTSISDPSPRLMLLTKSLRA